MFSEFIITDGTTSIDFLAANKQGAGVGMTRYTPGRSNLKGGGTWQDSPLARGRRLAHGLKGNSNDAVEFRIAYSNHTALIQMQEDLDLLLEKAIGYWTADWQSEPVYVKARAAGEPNPRYAVVYSAEFPSYPDPYDQPYTGSGKRFVMDGMILGLERGDWLANPPGTGTAIELSNAQSTATISPIYVVGHYKSQALTHIYYDSDAVNKINTLPLTLFNTGLADDAVYFGSPQPFSIVAFNLGTAMNATTWTITWEYSTPDTVSSSGLTWGTPTSVEDGTNKFSNLGQSLIRWSPSDSGTHTKYTLIGDDLYWLRARISAISGSVTLPVQVTRQVFIPTLPYVEIANDQISGDLNALVRVRCQMDVNDSLDTAIQNVAIGSRATDRGEDFTAYINMANNPAGIAITLPSGATLDSVDETSVTGTSVGWVSPDTTAWLPVVQVEIDASIAQQFFGRYRLFVQHISTGTTLLMRSVVYYLDAIDTSIGEAKSVLTLVNVGPDSGVGLADLGYIQLPPNSLVNSSEDSHTIVIELQAQGVTSTSIYFFVLLPTDEFAAQLIGQSPTATERYNFDIDSIGYPKTGLRGVLRLYSNDRVTGTFQVIGNQEASLAANAGQRLWFAFSNDDANAALSAAVSVTKNQRYHHLRSD